MTLPTPIVGDWYQDRDGELFEVVAIDADDHTIDVQYFDGTLQELDAGEWIEILPSAAEAPEDWTGSMDIEPEDNDQEAEPNPAPAWVATSQLDRDEASGYSEWPAA